MKLIIVAGARPNFMKVAPLIHAIQRHNKESREQNDESKELKAENRNTAGSQTSTRTLLDYRLVHTGQHYDAAMSDVFFKELGIPAPDFNLEVGSGSHAVQTAQVMLKFEPVLLNAFAHDPSPITHHPSHLPDWVVVVGDVNSTAACTLVASKLGVKVAHIEAGLRSFDRTMPEEINRLVTDAIADLLLTPSEDASENLRREGVPEEKIRLVGNIMIDALVANLPQARASRILPMLGLKPGGYVYVTLHRPSNVDAPESLRAIMTELESLAKRLPVIFPMHPRTRKMLAGFGIAANGDGDLKIIEPVGYHDSLCLTENARLVLTDSGGLQEESTWFRTPCLTLRPNTERPVTVTHGSNRLTTLSSLDADIRERLNASPRLGEVPAYWDGQVADRICESLLAWDPSRHTPGRDSVAAQPPLASK